MNKYCITGAVGTNTIIGTAASKAPQDVCNILKRNGYINLFLSINQNENAFKRVFLKFIQLRKILKDIPKDSTVLIQYPIYKYLFLPLFYLKGCEKQVLIHDLDSIRTKGKLSWIERLNLNSFDEIIVHTEAMKKEIRKFTKKDIYVLNCFDYLLDTYQDYTTKRELSKEICFAGNINKSYYLSSLIKNSPTLMFRLYGNWNKEYNFNGNFSYEGKFHPDKIGYLKGSWGLIWDGNTPKTCDGTWGQYLKIIASHKISLYIVAGLPLIAWEDSAMSTFIQQHNIGITVKSLFDLDKAISAVTEAQYELFLKNLSTLAKDLTNGNMLTSVLHQIENKKCF